jgi:hypothetical protein
LPQREPVNELAPHVFAGALGAGSPALAELAALGLVAGWEVGGVIKDASFASVVNSGGLDAGRWLEAALARPSGRATLLDPAARVLAVGALASQEPPAAAAVAVTYQLFGEEDLRADAERLRERIAAEREAEGRSPPGVLGAAAGALEQVAERLPSGRTSPREALDDALGRASAATSLALHGWVLEGTRLADLRIPDELRQWDHVRIGVAVGYYQPADEPWGRYVALIVATPPNVGV